MCESHLSLLAKSLNYGPRCQGGTVASIMQDCQIREEEDLGNTLEAEKRKTVQNFVFEQNRIAWLLDGLQAEG